MVQRAGSRGHRFAPDDLGVTGPQIDHLRKYTGDWCRILPADAERMARHGKPVGCTRHKYAIIATTSQRRSGDFYAIGSRARLTASRMVWADAVHRKGVAARVLWVSMNVRMAGASE